MLKMKSRALNGVENFHPPRGTIAISDEEILKQSGSQTRLKTFLTSYGSRSRSGSQITEQPVLTGCFSSHSE